jgi:hypothetical protein
MNKRSVGFAVFMMYLAGALSGWAQLAMKPPASGVLYDAAIGGPLANNDAVAEVIDYEGGKALKITFGTTANWPQVNILGTWDLSEYTAIEAKITNIGTGNEKLTMRADNPGSTADARWNQAVAYNGIAPGETVTLRIDFGYNNFRSQVKSYDLDKSNITQVLFSVKKPGQAMSYRLDSLKAVK